MLKTLLFCGVASVAAQPAFASEASEASAGGQSASTYDEIIVTARKREESLQKVPVSVTAFSGDQLLKAGAQDFTSFAQNNPNVQLTPTSGGGGMAISPTIRGNVNASSILSVDPSVGVYVDDYIMGHVWGTTPLIVDVESVQTLKGPQGTLFGRNTTGGAMLIKTVDPSASAIEGYVRGELSTYTLAPSRTNYRLGGALNLPISDKVAVRFAAQNIHAGNYQRLADGRELGEEERFLGRMKLLLAPTETMQVIATAEYTKETVHGTTSPSSYVDADGDPIYVGTPVSTSASGAVSFPADFRADRERKQYKALFLGVKAIQELANGGTIKFVAGHRKYDVDTLSSVPFILGPSNTFRPDNKETSVELQVNTPIMGDFIDLSAGLYFYDEDLTENTDTYDTTGVVRTAGSRHMDVTSTSKSLYVQGTAHLTDALNFTGGLRYTDDRKVAVVRQSDNALPLAQAHAEAFSRPAANYRMEDSRINYLVGLDYAPTDGVLVYVTHSTGYRAGGPQQARLSTNPASPNYLIADSFKPESMKNYEGGVKLQLFDRLLTMNGAVFYQDYSGYQYQGIDANAVRVSNNVNATIKGAEGEATLRLPSSTVVSANVGYVSAKVKGGFSDGFRLADVPVWTYGFSVSQGVDLGPDQALDLVAAYSYRGNFSTNVGAPGVNDEALGRVPGRGLLNLSATYTTGPFSFALFGNNVLNERYFSHVRNTSNGLLNFNQLGKPREVGVRAGLKF